jgi:hypothetical protein
MNAVSSPVSYLRRVGFWSRLRQDMLIYFVPLMLAASVPAAWTIIYNLSEPFPSPAASAPPIVLPSPTAIPSVLPILPTPVSDDSAQGVASVEARSAYAKISDSKDIDDFVAFVHEYPDSALTGEALAQINRLFEGGHLQLASIGNDAEIYGAILKSSKNANGAHPEDTPKLLNTLSEFKKLPERYNFGYAIYYSDGQKTVYSPVINPNAHVFFDPSKIDLSFKDDKTVCVKSLSLTANGIPQTSFENICFGGGGNIIRLMSIQHAVELDAEPLATSSRGVAWVLGLRGL